MVAILVVGYYYYYYLTKHELRLSFPLIDSLVGNFVIADYSKKLHYFARPHHYNDHTKFSETRSVASKAELETILDSVK
jgi:hypothetical protein